MFKIPQDSDVTITINDPEIAPVIAAETASPFAYAAYSASGTEHARNIFENCGLKLGEDVIVTDKDNLSEKIPVLPSPLKFKVGHKVPTKTFIQNVSDFGYSRVPRIENIGEFSVRGDVIDVFAYNSPYPTRFMFLGDQIESIRSIDATSYITQSELDACIVPPISDKCLIEKWETVLDTLKTKVSIIILEEQTKLKIWHCRDGNFKSRQTINFKTAPVANYFSALSVLVPEILWNVKTRGKTVVIFVGSSRACEKYLDTKCIAYSVTEPDNIRQNEINVIRQRLGISFELIDYNLVVYSLETGSDKNKFQISAEPILTPDDAESIDISALVPGQLVLHIKHGLGRYLGTKSMDLGDRTRDYLIIQYDGGTFVYLPVDQADQLYEYCGSPRRLDRI